MSGEVRDVVQKPLEATVQRENVGAIGEQVKRMVQSSVKQAIKERWRPITKINKHIKDARKSAAARYLQLKSGYASRGLTC